MKNSESRHYSFSLKLQATVALASVLFSYMPLPAQTQAAQPVQAVPAPGLPPAPQPNYTPALPLQGIRDYSKPNRNFPTFLKTYEPIAVAAPVTTNSQRLDGIVRNGKIYLSLADAIVLALENNYDIAIQRYNLDIADTELLRARAGSNLLGVPAGLVQGTLGGSGNTSGSLTSGGGPGGTSTASGGAAAGAGGLVQSTNGSGPTPEILDPVLTGTIQLERTTTPQATPFGSGGG